MVPDGAENGAVTVCRSMRDGQEQGEERKNRIKKFAKQMDI